jgi:hypothetical protein
MNNLQDFMPLFRMAPPNNQPTPEQLAAMQQRWSKFIGGIAPQAKLVSTSRPGFDGCLIDSNMQVSSGLNLVNNQFLSGNMVLKAAGLQEAADLAKDCPVLPMEGSVEVRSMIPLKS